MNCIPRIYMEPQASRLLDFCAFQLLIVKFKMRFKLVLEEIFVKVDITF
jgi:hypothetical protein